MKEERDFAGFVLPFAVGIYSVTGSHIAFSVYTSALNTLFLIGIVLLVAVIWRQSAESHNGVLYPKIMTVLLGFCCGGFIGTSHVLVSISFSDAPSVLENAADKVSAAIDGICFSEKSSNAIIKALITGDRSGIPPSIAESFRASGASHILALSGFHLGIIYGIVTWVLAFAGGRKTIRTLRSMAVMTLCGAYTIATGAGPSIIRAFIFIIMREAALITHRSSRTSSILLSALLVQLIADPASIHSVSFQLSYAAMAGIAYIFPALQSFWPAEDKGKDQEWPVLRKIWSSAALSLSCQLTTGPLAFLYFNSFPKHFLLTNLIAIPVTSLLIPAALLTLCLDCAGICPEIMVRITEMLVTALSGSLEIISQM